jgi:hypothetical protein
MATAILILKYPIAGPGGFDSFFLSAVLGWSEKKFNFSLDSVFCFGVTSLFLSSYFLSIWHRKALAE